MNFLKASIVTTGLIIVTVIGFIFFSFGSDYQLNLAQEAFLHKDYSTARASLQKLRGDLSPSRLALYHAYLDRAEGHLTKSAESLARARDNLKAHEMREVFFEILLNQAFNAYLEGEKDRLPDLLTRAENIFSHDAYLNLLKGADAFLHEDYETAQYLWEKPILRVAVSDWVKTAFDQYFSGDRVKLLVAHCLISRGKPTVARQVIEEVKDSGPAELQTQSIFLLGLSYVQEGNDKPVQASLPYFKLAISYFKRLPTDQPELAQQLKTTIHALSQAAYRFVDNGLYQEAVFVAQVLQNWNATAEVQGLAERLLASLQQGILEGNWDHVQPLAQALNQFLLENQSRSALYARLQNEIRSSLSQGHTSRVSQLWEAAKLFSPNPRQDGDQLAALAENKVLALLENDTPTLDSASPYLSLWQQLSSDDSQRLRFAKRLIDESKQLWLNDDQEAKGLRLMTLASSLTLGQDQEEMESYIEAALQSIYQVASQKDDIDKLPKLLEAVKYFKIASINLKDRNTVANFLEDAISHYQRGRTAEAAQRAEWILEVFPDDSRAQELLARIYYQEANYHKALPYLRSSPGKASPVREEALAVAEIIAGDRDEGLEKLERLSAQGHLISLDTKKRLGYGLLEQKDPDLALIWLATVDRPDVETRAAMSVAYYDLKEWQKCLDQIALLQAPYKNLDSLQGIAIASLIAMGRTEEAGQRIQDLLASTEVDLEDEISKQFKHLRDARFSHFDRFYIAGKYFQDIVKQPATALLYFNRVSPPTSEALLAKSEILFKAADLEGARLALESASKLESGSRHWILIQRRLGEVYHALGRLDQARACFEDLVQKDPKNVNDRLFLIEVLQDLHRWDLALKEMVTLRKSFGVDDADFRIEYLETLSRTENLEPLSEILRNWLEEEPQLTLVQRLKIGQIMHRLGNPTLVKAAIVSIPEDMTTLKAEEALAICSTFYLIGRIETALGVAEQFAEPFSQNVEACLLLANLYNASGHGEKAAEWSHRATQISPYAPKVLDYLDDHESTIAFLEEQLRILDSKEAAEQESISLRLATVQYLLATAVELTGPESESRQMNLVHRALRILTDIQEGDFDYPEVYFRLGQTSYLLGKTDKAVEHYQEAVSKDPSFAKAYKYLALALNEQGKIQGAHEALEKAVKWDPTDAEAWVQFARLNIQLRDLYQAKNSLENAIAFRPGYLDAYVQLGHVLLELKNPEDAYRLLDQALKIDPDHSKALALMMVCLLDPTVRAGAGPELDERTLETFKRLAEIDPKMAEEVRNQLHYEPVEKEKPNLDLY